MFLTDLYALEMPDHPPQKVWRYMDLAKFLDIIQTETLWFPSAALMQDTYELFTWDPNERDLEERRRTCISCWHLSEHESAFMWKTYLTHNDGIAIQTSVRDLCASVNKDPREIEGGQVAYERKHRRGVDDGIQLILCKRPEFRHECEFRLFHRCDETPIPHGVPIEVDIKTLVRRVYIAPTASPYIKRIVERSLRTAGKNGDIHLKSEVIQSPLYGDPHKQARVYTFTDKAIAAMEGDEDND